MIQHLKAIWTFRYFWASLVKMDLVTRYRKSSLGILWSLLHPLCMTAVFALAFWKLAGGSWQEYTLLTLCGMTVFGFLRDCTLQGSHALARNDAYIRQSPLPYSIYSLRVMLYNLVHFVISLVVLVLLAVVFSVFGAEHTVNFANMWMALPMVLVLAICAWATTTITAFVTVFFHDVSHMMEVAAQILFFLTPIFYKRELFDGRQMSYMVDWNPIAAFIEVIRSPLVRGTPATQTEYLTVFGVTAAVVGLAVLTVYKLSKRVIFYM
jgi:lipopolysaccharide transport system permease protein